MGRIRRLFRVIQMGQIKKNKKSKKDKKDKKKKSKKGSKKKQESESEESEISGDDSPQKDLSNSHVEQALKDSSKTDRRDTADTRTKQSTLTVVQESLVSPEGFDLFEEQPTKVKISEYVP